MNEKMSPHHVHVNPVLNALIQVSRAAEYVNQQMDIALEDLHITNVQYNILRILKQNQQAGIARVEIKKQLIAQSVDLTRSINGLVESGYAIRSRPENDRRLVLHLITETGIEALSKIDPILHDMLAQIGAKMTVDEWLSLNQLCLKMCAPVEHSL